LLPEIVHRLARNRRPEVARRFRARAEATSARLASMPATGEPYPDEPPALVGPRRSPIGRFRDRLIFDRATDDWIEVVRVVHGAREIRGILAAGLDPVGDEDEGTGAAQ
jgi:toxin ParE1/3/4